MRWIILLLLLLSACSGQEVPLEEPVACCLAMTADCLACSEGVSVDAYCDTNPGTTGCQESVLMQYTDLYAYDEISSVSYKAVLEGGSFMIDSTVSDEGDSYKLRAVYDNAPLGIVMFIDKETDGCLSTYTEVEDGVVEYDCPTEGPNSVNPQELVEVGEERLNGYDTIMYESDGVTYWVASDIPVPVQYAGEGYVMKLVSYE